jgi:hypothetical protein
MYYLDFMHLKASAWILPELFHSPEVAALLQRCGVFSFFSGNVLGDARLTGESAL